MFDPANPQLVGRRCTWNVYGIQYNGEIVRVITTNNGCYQPGDWVVKLDDGSFANVIGDESKLIEIEQMRVWLDDIREPPEGWTWVKTAPECIELLKTGQVTHISLDHDLGTDHCVSPNNGYDVAKWIEEAAYNKSIPMISCRLHTQNAVGRKSMASALQNAYRYWRS